MAILNELTQLSKMENSKVALRARQVTFTHDYHLNPITEEMRKMLNFFKAKGFIQ